MKFPMINILNHSYQIAFTMNVQNEDFLFIANKFGLADSFSGSLKTKNTYSLGGLNFKGFDYKGIGPFLITSI